MILLLTPTNLIRQEVLGSVYNPPQQVLLLYVASDERTRSDTIGFSNIRRAFHRHTISFQLSFGLGRPQKVGARLEP